MEKVIVATVTPANTKRWHGVMQKALPDFEVIAWEPGMEATGSHHAIVWAPPDEFFRTETRLRSVFNLGAGVDHLLALPSLPADLPIYRLEDAGMARQMAEYVLHALAWVARRFDVYEAQQREGLWQPLPPTRCEDWPVGVMGLGKLGQHVARMVSLMGYPVAGWARSPHSLEGVEIFHGEAGFNPFLQRTRVLVNLLPLTPHTRGIINASLISRLKEEAVVINIARGGHVVDEDLLAALDSGRVQAAMLDVFNHEPLPPDHPYWCHPRVRMTPHVSAITTEAETIRQVGERLRALVRGESVYGRVDRNTGY